MAVVTVGLKCLDHVLVSAHIFAVRNKRLRLTRPEPTEGQVLKSALEYLQLDRRVAWIERMNTGAYAVGTGKKRRWIRYGFKGCSDLLGQLVDGRLLAIEIKKPSGGVSPEQREFLDIVQKYGGVSGVARRVEDVISLCENAFRNP